MKREVLISFIIGLIAGVTFTSFFKNRIQSNDYQNVNEAVKLSADVAVQYIEGYKKLTDQKIEIFKIAQTYVDAKSSDDKLKIADSLVFKIKEYNLSISK